MAPLKELTPGDRLPARPDGYTLKMIWVDGRREVKALYSDEGGGGGRSSFVVSCSPSDDKVQSVGVFRGDGKYADATGASSPTKRYQRNRTSLYWSREAISKNDRSSYDAACTAAAEAVQRTMRPFRHAAERGRPRLVPLRSLSSIARPSFDPLVQEYAFHRGTPPAAPGEERGLVTSLFLENLVYSGVDIDQDRRLDVILAETRRSPRSAEAVLTVFLYDLGQIPPRLGLGIGKTTLPDQSSSPTGCDGRWTPPLALTAAPEPTHDRMNPLSRPPVGYLRLVTRCDEPAPIELDYFEWEYLRYVAQLPQQLRGDSSRQAVEEWIRRINHITLVIPPTATQGFKLPEAPAGRHWLPRTLKLTEVRWTSPEGGEVLFQIMSGSAKTPPATHPFRIPFQRRADRSIEFSPVAPAPLAPLD